MIRDFSKESYSPDFVACNQCGAEMLVDNDVDECPVCHRVGYLMDIEQNTDKTADELAYERYLRGEYTYQDYVDVCEFEECEPLSELTL